MRFGFTPLPLAPHYSRGIGDAAATKKALLVFPSYGAREEKNRAMHEYLMEMRLIPTALETLSVEAHIELLEPELIKRGFDVVPMATFISALELQQKIKDILQAAPDVLLIVYCGHGTRSPSGDGMFCLSDNWRIRMHERRALFAKYHGTLIQFFNMCQAGPNDPWAYNAVPAVTQPFVPYHEKCSHFTVYSSDANEMQKPKYALAATKAFLSLVGQPYAQLTNRPSVFVETAGKNEDGKSKGPTHLTIKAGAHYAGTFPDVASALVSS